MQDPQTIFNKTTLIQLISDLWGNGTITAEQGEALTKLMAGGDYEKDSVIQQLQKSQKFLEARQMNVVQYCGHVLSNHSDMPLQEALSTVIYKALHNE